MSTPLQSSISKIRREIIDQLDALENLATSKAKALETAEQRYLELERERDGLNRDQTQLAVRVDELKAELANRATVPRVITAGEVEVGQTVAVKGVVSEDWEIRDSASVPILFDGRVVLLEDAPAEEPEQVKVGDTISSDARAAELPKGTILLDDDADPWRKDKDGRWRAADRGSDELVYCTAEPVFYTNDPLTVLHLPEEEDA